MNTRTRILQAAEQLFVERGYHATTLREVAERVGITKPALYYHFESKSEILASLLAPMTTELEEVLADAVAVGESKGTAAMRRMLLAGWLEVFLRSRGALLALFRDLASMPPTLYQRLLVVLERAVEMGAGPNAPIADRIAMAQAISAITDPVALIPDLPTEVVREHLLAGAWRLIGEPAPASRSSNDHSAQPAPTRPDRTPGTHPAPTGPDHTPPSTHPAQPAPAAPGHTSNNHPAPGDPSTTPSNQPAPTGPSTTPSNRQAPAGRGQTSSNQPATTSRSRSRTSSNPPARGRGGRPKALSPAGADRIRELHASGQHTADSIATQLGVSRATVYRYLKTQF